MKLRRISLSLVAILWFLCPLWAQNESAKPGPVTVIKFGTLIPEDGSGRVLNHALVTVSGDRIRSVSTGTAQIPAGATVIDLSNYTGIPGLIDAHTHMTYYWSGKPGTTPFTESRARLPQETVFYAQANARQCLEIGVTTVRDLAAQNYSDLALRNLINAGAIEGPRMFVAGPGLHAGGAVPTLGFVFPGIERPLGQANGVPEVMQTVREEIAAGIDVVKMFASTGSFQDVTEHETFTYDEIQAAVQVAHQMGKRIAVHTYGPDGARDAARAGADTIEHPVDMDDATLREIAAKHIIYTPTVYHNVWYAENAKEFGWNDKQVADLDDFVRRNEETVRRALQAGVRIDMGSDAVYNSFGKNTHELEYLVKSGMTPAQALEAATANGAAALGMDKSLGAVAPGYFADIVAVEGNPLADVNAVIDGVRWVMKGGKVVVDHTRAEPGAGN
ncbi:MAG TPA: amidohydrolase family protein [Candidatus Acidoferrales bacterium]|nr:amidohydrolase family protein [Candidatus Acidoferrales bacterium]